jgi:tripartite ATP-independent transporter DctP family solute receptor
MKRLFIKSVLATVVLAAFGAASAQDIKERTIKFALNGPEGHPAVAGMKKFSELVAAKSGGKIKVNLFLAGVLGSDQANVSAIQGGTLEMAVMNTGILASVAKELAIFDFPFLFANEKESDAVVDGAVGKRLHAKLEEKGLVGLVYWENGFRNLTNSKRPVNKLEDLDGVKLRVMQNEVFLSSFKSLGANAIPLPFSELFSALETKTVDGQENPYNTILSSKFYEVQKYLSITNHVYSPWIVTVSKKWWDGLSKDEKKVLMDAATKSRDFERKDTREEAARALADLKAKGMQINELTPAETARMRDKLTRVNASVATNVGMDLWNETQAALGKLRGK